MSQVLLSGVLSTRGQCLCIPGKQTGICLGKCQFVSAPSDLIWRIIILFYQSENVKERDMLLKCHLLPSRLKPHLQNWNHVHKHAYVLQILSQLLTVSRLDMWPLPSLDSWPRAGVVPLRFYCLSTPNTDEQCSDFSRWLWGKNVKYCKIFNWSNLFWSHC